MKIIPCFAAVAALSLVPSASVSAQTINLFLRSNGADIQGEPTLVTLGRANSIECIYFEDAVATSRQAGTGLATGRRTYEPIVFRKRIDKSTPLLAKSLANNEVVTGAFRFFRPNPVGDGTTEQFFTVEFGGGRIASIKRIAPIKLEPATMNQPVYEEVSIVFQTITWTYVNGGVTFTDSQGGAAGSPRTLTPARPPVRPPVNGLMALASALGQKRDS